MRYAPGHKEAVRRAIVDAAARALRRDGLDGVSIPGIMKDVGLTHGGFYSHFEDRDELVAEALWTAAESTGSAVFREPIGGIDASLALYLSRGHVENPAGGCVLAALGTDAHRQGPTLRRAFAGIARGFIGLVQGRLSGRTARRERPSDEALETAARMIGAVVLARLVDDDRLAGRILDAARRPPR